MSFISAPPYICDVKGNNCARITNQARLRLHSLVLAIMAADEQNAPVQFFSWFSTSFPHILQKIFFSLDYQSYKTCLEVSNEWKSVLTSETYKTKVKSVFKKGIMEDEKKLNVAAGQGNTDEVRELLSSCMVDVNSRDDRALTPLHHAASRGHKDVAHILIEWGADINVSGNGVKTPLHFAAKWGQPCVVQFLIQNGADVNSTQGGGCTPLHTAAINGHREIAELLLENGAEVNATDSEGLTPLHWAAKMLGPRREMAQLLIERGADVEKADNGGTTPSEYL